MAILNIVQHHNFVKVDNELVAGYPNTTSNIATTGAWQALDAETKYVTLTPDVDVYVKFTTDQHTPAAAGDIYIPAKVPMLWAPPSGTTHIAVLAK